MSKALIVIDVQKYFLNEETKPIVLKDLTWSTSEEQLHHPALQMAQRNIGFVE